MLAGLIFDAGNHRLVSSHATNNGKRYRYYITSDGAGRSVPGSNAAKVRVSAAQIDDLVLSSLSGFLNDKQKIVNFLRKHRSRAADVESALEVASHLADVLVSDSPGRKQVLVADLLSRVTIEKTSLKISVRPTQLRALLSNRAAPSGGRESEPDILLEAQFNSSTVGQQATRLLIEDGGRRRSEPDPVVVKAVARAHWWFEQLVTGKARSMAEIAARDSITDNYVSNLIHLAWLPPRQVDLILEGEPAATQLAKNSMLTRNVDIMWRESPGRVHGRR